MKETERKAPVMGLLDFGKPFTLETDACNTGVGVVLMQEGRPLAYLNQILSPRYLSLSIYEKELLVVLMAMEKWRHYLRGVNS